MDNSCVRNIVVQHKWDTVNGQFLRLQWLNAMDEELLCRSEIFRQKNVLPY